MLSAYGAAVVGYIGDGYAIHHHCAIERYGQARATRAENGLDGELHALIRYTAEMEWPEGLSCDHCSGWIVEPQYDCFPEEWTE